jgi:hypothetical protein
VAATVSYNRRMYGNFTVIDNLAVAPSDYDPYCITSPLDSRLPGGGGQRICGLYDVTPAKASLLDRYRTLASNYGDQYEYWQGIDMLGRVRLPNGVTFSGGVSTGQRVTDNCDVVGKVDNPSPLYCHTTAPLWAPSTKFALSYPLARKFVAAATFQSIPGLGDSTNPSVAAFYVATNAEICTVPWSKSVGRTERYGDGQSHRAQQRSQRPSESAGPAVVACLRLADHSHPRLIRSVQRAERQSSEPMEPDIRANWGRMADADFHPARAAGEVRRAVRLLI